MSGFFRSHKKKKSKNKRKKRNAPPLEEHLMQGKLKTNRKKHHLSPVIVSIWIDQFLQCLLSNLLNGSIVNTENLNLKLIRTHGPEIWEVFLMYLDALKLRGEDGGGVVSVICFEQRRK